MAAPIVSISGAAIVNPIRLAGEATGSSGFQDVMKKAIQGVEGLRQDASASVERFLSGEGEELHTTILATQRADLAFEMFQQVRNKVVSAYQEIMRLQM